MATVEEQLGAMVLDGEKEDVANRPPGPGESAFPDLVPQPVQPRYELLCTMHRKS